MFKDRQDSGRKCHHSFHNNLSIRTIDIRITNTGYHLLLSYNKHRRAQITLEKQKQNSTNYTRITNTEKHQLHSHNKKHRTAPITLA
jgi:hypothetical protein